MLHCSVGRLGPLGAWEGTAECITQSHEATKLSEGGEKDVETLLPADDADHTEEAVGSDGEGNWVCFFLPYGPDLGS